MINPTVEELNQLGEIAVPLLGSDITKVKGFTWAAIPEPDSVPEIMFVVYTGGQSVPNSSGILRRRTTCRLGHNPSCGQVKDVLWYPTENEVLLDGDIPPADLSLLINHLASVLETGESLATIRYGYSGGKPWSLENAGYEVTANTSSGSITRYRFIYSCSFFGRCRWRMRFRMKEISLCGPSPTCLGC